MPSRRAYAWNANARNAYAVPLVLDEEVQMQSFRMPIQLLAQSMTNQNNQQVLVPTNRNDQLVAAIICDFVRMNSPKCLGSQFNKNQKKFIDKVKKIFGVMQVTGSDRVKLASN